jgi:Protein of unknown function (DUF3604)
VRARLALGALALAACGKLEGPGEIHGRAPVPAAELAARVQRERAADPGAAKQILFGDLHVHTTYSTDAFLMSLPLLQGEGPNPVGAACDYARYCSALDFWSITDHAEGMTPRMWRETKESIRECNAVAGDPESPDLVAFLGWEWTQIGETPADHYGHKNVILRETAEDRVPRRPIHSDSFASRAMRQRAPLSFQIELPLRDWANRERIFNLGAANRELRGIPRCEDGVDTRELPEDCAEGAATPELLFAKLDQWGFDALVIPHGTTWGIYTPAGSAWDKQLTPAQNDAARQRLIEVYSGHGNSEEYRDFRDVEFGPQGEPICPEPVSGYEPCCWRAGEIIRERCGDPASPECEKRVAEARRLYLEGGVNARSVIPGASVADWRDCGSCPDCFVPAFNYRPQSSVQYIMARGHPGAEPDASQFRLGFVASSDNHSARPGTGYKERDRLVNTESRGARDQDAYEFATPQSHEPKGPEPRSFESIRASLSPFQTLDFERQASFFTTGGLAAVHAERRSRDAIWDALMRKETYGTSGPRLLLWFDLVNGDAPRPMGSEVRLAESPRFRARAAGDFEQLPGCPDWAESALSADDLERLCRRECYHPGPKRLRIERIEVVRIRPRRAPDEAPGALIDDPWRILPCPAGDVCSVEFDDPDFVAGGRSALYYVRAIQEATPAVNGAGMRCKERDARGVCLAVDPCYGDYRTPASDDCLAPVEERAWSSPIFVDPG